MLNPEPRTLNPFRRTPAALVFALMAAVAVAGCRGRRAYPNRPITLICPWAAGGGTDRVSRQVAALLEQELGVPVNVINATGGAGVTGHTRGALARPDGYTLTMVTVEINMLHWRGLTNVSYDDYRPIGLINRDAAALFVRQDASWEDLGQLEQHIRSHPRELKASGTAQGGIWHLGFAGWLNHVGLSPADAIWVSINGAAPSLQELIAGGVDAVCCSLPEAQSLLDAGRVRCLGVMADERLEQFPQVPTFREQGVDWTLTGWRGVCVPKDTPTRITQRLVDALEHVAKSDAFKDFMRSSGFDATWEPPDEFAATMERADEQLGSLLTSEAFRSMHRTRFGPMFFPAVLFLLLGLVFLGLIGTGGWRRPPHVEPISRQGLVRSAEIVIWVAAYLLLVETAGFLLTAATLCTLLMWRLGDRSLVHGVIALAVTAAIVPLAYLVFAVYLRVPLPRGWLGW
jgi:tripartite-type tricarboxylate transporter receptor subunit TctC